MIPASSPSSQLMLFDVTNLADRPARRRAMRAVSNDEIEKWLAMPLFTLDGQPSPEACVDTILDDVVFEAVDGQLTEDEPACEREPWTQDGILHLHSVLLEESLRTLASRGNAGGKKEILDWIFEPEYLGTTLRHGREVPVYANAVPFAFSFCCRLERMDPESIREQLLLRMPQALKQLYQ